MHKETAHLLREVVLAVLPVSLIVCVLQLTLLHMPWDVFARFAHDAFWQNPQLNTQGVRVL